MRAEAPDSYMWSPGGPLSAGSLGMIGGDKFDRPVFDDKVAKDREHQYDGLNGGVNW